MGELPFELNRLAGTTLLDAQGAANVWAGTTNLDLVGALNTKAGNVRPAWLELAGVLNQLAGTTGLGVNAAAAAIGNPAALTGLKLWLDADQPVGGYLSLPGTAGNYASCPDSAALSITGDLDLRVKVAMVDWTPIATQAFLSKSVDSGNQRGYRFDISSTGVLVFRWSPNGSTINSPQSTVAVGAVDGSIKWVRATFDVDNGAAGNDVKFYTSDDGITWIQLGATVTTAGVASIFDNTAPVEIGSVNVGTALAIAGKVHYAEVRNGIGGTIVAAADFNRRVGTTSFTDGPGNVWTINGASSVFVNASPAESSHVMAWRDRTANLYDATQTVRTAAPKYLHPGYLSLPGTTGNYVSTPDSAALSITGDIDIRVKVAMNDWTPALGDTVFMGKYVVTGSQKSWLFTNTGTGGALRLYISANGSSANLVDSSIATGFTDGSTHWVRATWSDSGDVANFYTSEDGITWVQLGAANRALASAGIFDSTAAVEVGSFSTGTTGYMSGNVYYADVRNNILNDGTGVVAVADFEDKPVGTTTWTGPQGNVWTVNGASSAFVKTLNGKPVLRFDGVDDQMSLANLMSGAAAGTGFVVLRVMADPPANGNQGGGPFQQWGADNSNLSFYPFTDGKIYEQFGVATRMINFNASPSLTNPHVYGVISAPSDGRIYLDGALLQSVASTVGWGTNPRIGGRTGNPFLTGDIAEVIVYDRALSDAERKSIERYLGTKYGITVS